MMILRIGVMLLVFWGIHAAAHSLNDYIVERLNSRSIYNAQMEYIRANKNKMFAMMKEDAKKDTVSVKDIQCLAKNIYFEARNQGIDGMTAVGYVTINRVNSNGFPDTVCGVVYAGMRDNSGNLIPKKCQFMWACPSGEAPTVNTKDAKEREAWYTSLKIAQSILAKPNKKYMGGITHFHTDSIEPPSWAKSERFEEVAKINNHIFYIDTHLTRL